MRTSGHRAILEALARHASDPAPGAVRKAAVIHSRGGDKVETLTYGGLATMAAGISRTLAEDGVGPGSLVGIGLERSTTMVAALVGVLLRSASFFTVSPKLKPSRLTAIQAVTDATAMVLDSVSVVRLGHSGIETLAGKMIYLVDDGSPLARHAYTLVESHTKVRRLTMSVVPAGPFALDDVPAPTDSCMVLLTSGSTGSIKSVRVPVDDLYARATAETEAYGITAADRVLNLLPFSFDVGCNQLFSTLTAGASLVISHAWSAADVCGAVRKFRVSGLSAVPTIWSAILAYDPDDAGSALRGLRYGAVSGGAMARPQIEGLQRLAPRLSIYKTYGQTETFRSSMLRPDQVSAKADSVGRPVPGVEVHVQKEDGTRARAGEVGEILHAGAGIMLGYAGDAAATRARRVPNPFGAGLVVRTGDLGFLDDDGFLHIRGRIDRMIKTRGSRMYPQEVEAVATRYPGVVDAVAFGVTGAGAEVSVGLAVTTNQGVEPVGLNQFLRKHLATFMIPQRIWLLSDLPRTLSGKIDVPATEEWCARRIPSWPAAPGTTA
ncbi:class I adenylate-forming enzyme family protein [Actinoplanes sp. NPDC049265]|uniref:class I adenylate-forming enzyme family protein n=1 Tax=Actinoplanes sp. NPDC049265 TaxID=3363902 RepID=UPI00372205F0